MEELLKKMCLDFGKSINERFGVRNPAEYPYKFELSNIVNRNECHFKENEIVPDDSDFNIRCISICLNGKPIVKQECAIYVLKDPERKITEEAMMYQLLFDITLKGLFSYSIETLALLEFKSITGKEFKD